MKHETRLILFILLSFIFVTIIVTGVWIRSGMNEVESLKAKNAELAEENLKLGVSEDTKTIKIKDLQRENLEQMIDLKVKEAALDYAKVIIRTQASYIDFVGAVADVNNVTLPDIVYPRPEYKGVLEELFGGGD